MSVLPQAMILLQIIVPNIKRFTKDNETSLIQPLPDHEKLVLLMAWSYEQGMLTL